MHCKKYILVFHFLLIIYACSHRTNHQILLPCDSIDVLVLSKYALKEAHITVKGAQVFFDDHTFDVKSGNITINAHNDTVSLVASGKVVTSEYIIITTDKHLNITFNTKNKNMSRIYNGTLKVKSHMGKLMLVNRVEIEEYVYSSACAELGPFFTGEQGDGILPWQRELLKAMEIAIRSYIFAFTDRHPSPDYQFCDLTHCVFFPGIIIDGKSMTGGEVMHDSDNNFVPAYFHSTCGGVLDGPESYWEKHKAHPCFRRGKDITGLWGDYLCEKSPHSTWKIFISLRQLKQIIGKDVVSLKAEYNKSLRASSLEYRDADFSVNRIPVSEFISRSGRVLGWHVVKSNLFKIKEVPGGWEFSGRGLGHGIGLCQWGAAELAKKGYSYKEILEFYYNSPVITRGRYNDDQ